MKSFLSCPNLAFCDVIGESSHLIQTVKNDPFYSILASTCLISRSEKRKLFEH